VDSSEVLNRSAEPPDVVVRYAEHSDAVMDVYLPPSLGPPARPSPLLFAVHGGFWREAFDRRHLRPLANALALRGFTVALPEYRRVGGLGGWPLTGHDVEAALAACPGLVDATAPGRIDAAAPCVVAGHSAGGHLALWAGLRAGASRVSRIVALAPVTDLVYAADHGFGGNAAQALLGGSPRDLPERYAAADAHRLLPGGVPVTILHGSDDVEVPVEINRRVADEKAAGSSLRYVELAGIDHFALIDPLSAVFESAVLAAIGTGA
jgi:acetyl esterase/lipase